MVIPPSLEGIFSFFKINIYLFERQNYRERKRGFLSSGYSPMIKMARPGSGSIQEPAASHRSLMWVSGVQALRLSSSAFTGTLAGSRSRSRAASTRRGGSTCCATTQASQAGSSTRLRGKRGLRPTAAPEPSQASPRGSRLCPCKFPPPRPCLCASPTSCNTISQHKGKTMASGDSKYGQNHDHPTCPTQCLPSCQTHNPVLLQAQCGHKAQVTPSIVKWG